MRYYPRIRTRLPAYFSSASATDRTLASSPDAAYCPAAYGYATYGEAVGAHAARLSPAAVTCQLPAARTSACGTTSGALSASLKCGNLIRFASDGFFSRCRSSNAVHPSAFCALSPSLQPMRKSHVLVMSTFQVMNRSRLRAPPHCPGALAAPCRRRAEAFHHASMLDTQLRR